MGYDNDLFYGARNELTGGYIQIHRIFTPLISLHRNCRRKMLQEERQQKGRLIKQGQVSIREMG